LFDSGSAYVFVRSGTTWSEQQKLVPADTQEFGEFGVSLSLSGERVLIGAHEYDYSGAVYIFARSGSAWSQETWFSPSDNQPGDFFGECVALSGDTALIGAPFNDIYYAGTEGAAYVFVKNPAGGYWDWDFQQKLSAVPRVFHGGFGASVALDGDLAAVGDTGLGTVELFKRTGTTWERPLQLSAGGNLGYAVGLSDNTVVAGTPSYSFGLAHVFGLASPASIYCTAGISASGCRAVLHHLGGPSASAPSGFSLVASEVEGAKDGLYYFGTHGRQANPWGNGTSYQCVVPPLVRLPVMAGTGTAGQCDGWFTLDLNAHWCPTCPKPDHNPGVGTTVQAQLWYRDPLSTSNQTTSLSDAIELVVAP
jgi:hypothetical protein